LLYLQTEEYVMKRITRVLCIVNDTQADRAAFTHALALARQSGAAMFIVCTISPGQLLTTGYTERLAHLLTLRVAAETAGLDVRIDVRHGQTPRVIQQEARRRLPSVIVLTASDDAPTVVQSAACPVLIVRPADVPAGPRPFERVLCAVDSWRSPRTAIARSLAVLPGSGRLTLLHVDGRSQGALESLQRLQRLIPPTAGRPVRVAVSVGSIVPEILRAAKEARADLVVVGTYARRSVSQEPAGIVPDLLARAQCPVLVVPVSKRDLRERLLPAA
jgi:nucleotide-binding universal stress UspA family protein